MQQQHTCTSTSAVLYLWRMLAAHEHDSLNEARVFKKKNNSTAIISFQQFLSSVQTWNDKWIVCFRLESRQYLKGLWSLPQNPTTPRKTPRWTFVKAAAAELISNHPPYLRKPLASPLPDGSSSTLTISLGQQSEGTAWPTFSVFCRRLLPGSNAALLLQNTRECERSTRRVWQ